MLSKHFHSQIKFAPLTFEYAEETQGATIQMKAIEEYFPLVG